MTMTLPVTSAAQAAHQPAPAPASASRYGFGDDGFTFGDFLDIINPLQHIPVVGTIYRALTGDTMEAGAEIAGGALYGGPIGALLSVADVAFTESTGKPIDETMLAWIGIGGHNSQTAVAHNAAVPATAAQATRIASAAPAPSRAAMPARLFPAATTRIVPLAGYMQTPVAAPPASPAPSQTPAVTTAAAPPALSVPATPELEGAQALLAALRDSGVDPASAARAAAAYQAGLTLQSPVARDPASDSERR